MNERTCLYCGRREWLKQKSLPIHWSGGDDTMVIYECRWCRGWMTRKRREIEATMASREEAAEERVLWLYDNDPEEYGKLGPNTEERDDGDK